MSTRVAWDSTKRNHGQIHADFSAIARAVQSRGHPKPGSSGDGEITVCSSAEVTAPWAARAAVRTSFGLDRRARHDRRGSLRGRHGARQSPRARQRLAACTPAPDPPPPRLAPGRQEQAYPSSRRHLFDLRLTTSPPIATPTARPELLQEGGKMPGSWSGAGRPESAVPVPLMQLSIEIA